ncbi:BrnT family toxin [Candidatus Gottesmanbacteria bacterium]|nr:BrnT family toxin [Candidatus Gottesmanbacteria bacterium]
MQVKPGETEFEWDAGNLIKSRRKHGVTPEESESVFLDPDSFIVPDEKHSKNEDRLAIIGSSKEKRTVFVVFTRRRGKIRIISARRMHRKEVESYGQIKKNSRV